MRWPCINVFQGVRKLYRQSYIAIQSETKQIFLKKKRPPRPNVFFSLLVRSHTSPLPPLPLILPLLPSPPLALKMNDKACHAKEENYKSFLIKFN